MNPVSARLLSQQLESPQFRDPAEVVSWFGAMQAQDPRSMRWAVTMRTRQPSFMAFEKAFSDGKIIRAHLLRCTWQIVTADDYNWIRSLIYEKSLAVMNGWTSAMGFKFTSHERDKTISIIEGLLQEKGVALEEEINQALLEGGIPKEHLFYSHHLRMAELEGIVCSGPLGKKSTYMLTRERVGESAPMDRAEALGMLAVKYFRSHGPATLEDFVWWSGLGIGECRRGIEACGKAITSFLYKGREFFVHEESRTRGFRSGKVLLLPSYDEYLIGYKSRDVVLHPDYSHHAHDKKGIFHHVVAYDGEIIGNWHPSAKDGAVFLFKEGIQVSETSVNQSLEKFHTAQKR